ncbi:MAG: long-chain fatty acid--CoA ligase [Rhodospirillaceae bacterium]|nr:long-chain fatty acid--CoA ligase [Rhodospirillaceae bacterium]
MATTEDAERANMPWLLMYPEAVDWNAEITDGALWENLDAAVARYPNQNLIDFLDRKYTFAQVGELVSRAAKGFQDIGVGRGIKVGLFLPNCPQFVICYYAILKAGGTVVNYSPLYSEPELEYQVSDSHTDIMVTLNVEALYPKMRSLLPKTRLKKLVIGTIAEVLPFPKNLLYPLVKRKEISRIPRDDRHIWFKDIIANSGDYSPVDVDPQEDVAVLQYTGGTTGVSKGAMLTHANLLANVQQACLWNTDMDEGKERMMAVLPFFHVFAMTSVMNLSIARGAEMIVHPRFDLEDAMRDISRKKPTAFQGVPTMYNAMANHPKISEFDLSSIKTCISGGAPLPVEVKAQFEGLAGCTVMEGYGLTESSPIATCNPLQGLNKAGSIGLPLPRTEIIIVDRQNPHKVLGVGEDGEICVKGPQVMKGYWNSPEATAETIVDGRLRTGDVGYMDEGGYTFIIDRMKDLILCSGFNVYPRRVEEACYEHPAVEEVTVIGIPDDHRGEAPKAFIKLKEGAEPIDGTGMIAFLRDRLGKHEIPREVEFRAELPKTLIGKLSKKELVEEESVKHEASRARQTGSP